MLRERGPRATNQTKNILTNLPGRESQPYITWKSKPESGFMRERFNQTYQPTNNKSYNLGVASNSFYNIYDICNNFSHNGFGVSRHPSANRTKCPGGTNDYKNGAFIKFKPNPIKHWRKQLIPNQPVNSRRVSVRQAIDTPGGTTRLDAKIPLNNNPICKEDVNHIPNYVKNNDMSIDNKIRLQNGCSIYNPQRIQRSASTIVKRDYHQTHSAYLRSRVKLYNQNQTLSQRKDNEYYENPNQNVSEKLQVLPPTNSRSEGSQLFNSTSIIDPSFSENCKCPNVIYKPNNVHFSNEGAVSSNLRTFNLQRQVINKNAHSLKKDFGTSAVNNSQYRGVGEAPITTKTFYQILPGSESACKNIQIRNTQNSGRQLAGGSGRHVVCQYNQPGLHNSDTIPSVNGNIIIKNRGVVNFKVWAKGPLFPQKFSCQTIRQAIGRSRQLQNNHIQFFYPNCSANPKNPPSNRVGTNGQPLSAAHR